MEQARTTSSDVMFCAEALERVLRHPGYILVAGKHFGSQIVLANVYGPNWDNSQFFSRFIAKLPDHLITHLVFFLCKWFVSQISSALLFNFSLYSEKCTNFFCVNRCICLFNS